MNRSLAPDHIVSTTLYNGQFLGPLPRSGRRSASSRLDVTPFAGHIGHNAAARPYR
jgi:hypothetical protein